MGARKHTRAQERKEARKTQYMASYRRIPTSPRKMRLVADMIRGMNVETALFALQYSHKEAARRLYQLLRSAIANWEVKNKGARVDYSTLYIKEIYVDPGSTLKRIKPAAQGRANRIRKRSNHVTMVLDTRNTSTEN
ncbi:MAG: 50S ribosomal protein L22 [Bacteroidales bacterium]|jgi:large subunit ribosomal protein L22|nr:50S ribosomal protein L22 [Bacteroidales bacterium]MCK9449196.1 50S ribosomal protein L22 [Bacteroidales bacterium]MDD3701766.1 50S ribosomal protein L22 [Bacteroidales bacterium]MDY0370147.1 50S ribosomal protein L22 [Bacteroidales bacterium]